MRFDDRLATLLALPQNSDAARANLWRQLVDLAAQGRLDLVGGQSRRALELIDGLRDDVPSAVRTETLAALPAQGATPSLMLLLAREPVEVIAPLLVSAQLKAEQWLAVIPRMSPGALALLKQRGDLPGEVAEALAGALAGAGQSEEKREEADVVALSGSSPKAIAPPLEAETEFRFEAGSDGVIFWTSSRLRGPVIGQTIAFAVPGSVHGVDGHAAGAFRQRAPFRDARLVIAGDGPLSGEWRISGTPIFSTAEGRFRGYRGTAHRAEIHSRAAVVRGGDGTSDSLRQLVHELRTPLTAIIGFAEVIEGQYLGPAASFYRARATDIRLEGERLLMALEDLDLSSRPGEPQAGETGPDALGEMIVRIVAEQLPSASQRGVQVDLRLEHPGHLALDLAAVERMCARLIGVVLDVAQRGETLVLALEGDPLDPQAIRLSISRPVMLAGRDEATLLDPVYDPDVPGRALLSQGLGFALRLVRNMARVCGARLDIGDDRFSLVFPLRMPQKALPRQGEG